MIRFPLVVAIVCGPFLEFSFRYREGFHLQDVWGQWSNLPVCLNGPNEFTEAGCLGRFDTDNDCDVDLRDYGNFQTSWGCLYERWYLSPPPDSKSSPVPCEPET